jgi:hypothetical protein
MLITFLVVVLSIYVMAEGGPREPQVGDKFVGTKVFTNFFTQYFANQGKGSTIVRPNKNPYKIYIQCSGCDACVEGTNIERKLKHWEVGKKSKLVHVNCLAPSAPKLKTRALQENKQLMSTAAICAGGGKGSKAGIRGLISWAAEHNSGLTVSRFQGYSLMKSTRSLAHESVNSQFRLVRSLFEALQKLNYANGCRTVFKTDAKGRFETAGILWPGLVEFLNWFHFVSVGVDACFMNDGLRIIIQYVVTFRSGDNM